MLFELVLFYAAHGFRETWLIDVGLIALLSGFYIIVLQPMTLNRDAIEGGLGYQLRCKLGF